MDEAQQKGTSHGLLDVGMLLILISHLFLSLDLLSPACTSAMGHLLWFLSVQHGF